MNENLLRFKKNQKYIFFDYETCNLNLGSFKNKPWQLAFIVTQGDKIIEEKEFYIDWDDLNISDGAKRVTGFSQKKYDKFKVCPRSALNEFEKFIYNNNYIIVGHNILGFDVYIHNIHRRLLGLGSNYSYLPRIIDTNCLARSFKNKIEYKNDSDMISWQYKLLNYRKKGIKTNLQQLCKDFKIEFDPNLLHDALYDVKKTHDVFQQLLWKIDI